jgi:hypothetical protein
MCMQLGLNQTKNGFIARSTSIKSSEAAKFTVVVSMRFLVSGQVSSHFCLPYGPARMSPGGNGRRHTFHDAARTKLRSERRFFR